MLPYACCRSLYIDFGTLCAVILNQRQTALLIIMTVWPSGLRRQTQVLVEQSAWVRTPQLSLFYDLFNQCLLKTPPTGLEPAIFGLEVQRVIHYATGARPGFQIFCPRYSNT